MATYNPSAYIIPSEPGMLLDTLGLRGSSGYANNTTKLYELGTRESYEVPGRSVPDYADQKMTTPVIDRKLNGKATEGTVAPQPRSANIARTASDQGTKVTRTSETLLNQQKELETYSAEVAMMFEAIRTVVSRAMNKTFKAEDLEFYANFGSPIVNNVQRISIALTFPIDLRIMLIRELVNGKLKWSADVGVTDKTPLMVSNRLIDAKKAGGELPIEPISTTREDVQGPQQYKDLPSIEKDKRRRKITL